MELSYPFARVFPDSTNLLNVFFCHDAEHSTFHHIGEIGIGIVDFCELDFSEVQKKIQTLETMMVANADFEEIKTGFWEAADLLAEFNPSKHQIVDLRILAALLLVTSLCKFRDDHF